jgi:hypothetical protein
MDNEQLTSLKLEMDIVEGLNNKLIEELNKAYRQISRLETQIARLQAKIS